MSQMDSVNSGLGIPGSFPEFNAQQKRCLRAIWQLIVRKISPKEPTIEEISYTVFKLNEDSDLDRIINKVFNTVYKIMPNPRHFNKVADLVLLKEVAEYINEINDMQETIEQWNLKLNEFKTTFKTTSPQYQPYEEDLKKLEASYLKSTTQTLIEKGKKLKESIKIRTTQDKKEGISSNALNLITYSHDVTPLYVQANISHFHRNTKELKEQEKRLTQEISTLEVLLSIFKKSFNLFFFLVENGYTYEFKGVFKVGYAFGSYQYLKDPPSTFSESEFNFAIDRPDNFIPLFNALVEKEQIMAVKQTPSLSFHKLEDIVSQWTPCQRTLRTAEEQELLEKIKKLLAAIHAKTDTFLQLITDTVMQKDKMAVVSSYAEMDFEELANHYKDTTEKLQIRIERGIDYTISDESLDLVARSHDISVEALREGLNTFKKGTENFIQLQNELASSLKAMNQANLSLRSAFNKEGYYDNEKCDRTLLNESYFYLSHSFGGYHYLQDYPLPLKEPKQRKEIISSDESDWSNVYSL